MNKAETKRKLYELMEEISQECWCAGWLDSLSFDLWEIAYHWNFADAIEYGQSNVTYPQIIELLRLSKELGGWLIYDEKNEDYSKDENDTRIVRVRKWWEMYVEYMKDRGNKKLKRGQKK